MASFIDICAVLMLASPPLTLCGGGGYGVYHDRQHLYHDHPHFPLVFRLRLYSATICNPSLYSESTRRPFSEITLIRVTTDEPDQRRWEAQETLADGCPHVRAKGYEPGLIAKSLVYTFYRKVLFCSQAQMLPDEQ